MSEWINPYLKLTPQERHLTLVKYFWSMPNREIEYQHAENIDDDIRNYVRAQDRDWKRRKKGEVRFNNLENIALLLQLSSGTLLFRDYIYQSFERLTIFGIIRDEESSKRELIELFGPNKGIEKDHSSPIFPICDLGNEHTEGIFGEGSVRDCEQRGYKYVIELRLMSRRSTEKISGLGSYEKLPGVVKFKMIERDQEWYRAFIDRYGDSP